MLDSLILLRAMNGIHEEDVVMAGNIYYQNRKTKPTGKIIRITLLAAVIASLLTAGAYAKGFLGSKAIIIPESTTESGDALISITQPQAVPEEIDSEVNEKVENTQKAWNEWLQWRETSPDIPHMPGIFTPPKGAAVSNYVKNEDGSYTLYFFDKEELKLIHDGEDGEADFSAARPLEVRTASAKEMADHDAWIDYVNLSYGDYDFNYDIHTRAEAEKLEEIAAKYGLHLRHGSTVLWSKETVEESDAEMNATYGTDLHTDTDDPRFLSNRELCERISDVACHGDLFRKIPRGFDKVYFFDEGTFCVSYDHELDTGLRVRCYGYNSMYATLSSGREVVSQITAPESYQTRTHTAPDGTELTILQKDNEAFLYVYLDKSFFEMHIHSDGTLSETDVDAVADNLNYGNIGK